MGQAKSSLIEEIFSLESLLSEVSLYVLRQWIDSFTFVILIF